MLAQGLADLGFTDFIVRIIQSNANLTKPWSRLSRKESLSDGHLPETAPISASLVLDSHLSWCVMLQALVSMLFGQEGPSPGYYSRVMTAAESNYASTKQELLATVQAVCVFRCYRLSGKQLNLVNDNRPTVCIFSQCCLDDKPAGVTACSACNGANLAGKVWLQPTLKAPEWFACGDNSRL